MPNGDDKSGTLNRGPADIDEPQVIKTGGPPQPIEDKPVSIALHDLIQKVANMRLEINELMRRLDKLEEWLTPFLGAKSKSQMKRIAIQGGMKE